MTEPLVSVIIPVYKAEAYLDRCLESVTGQSHRALEILLVDDGSPDRSGALCDAWAEKDPRVRVIHRENGGQAAARNDALDAATGDYIQLVDSDDWIAPDMTERLLRELRDNDCDMAICEYCEVSPDGRIKTRGPHPALHLLTRDEALLLLIQGRVLTNHLPRCLFRREVFDGVRFPEGMYFEDMYLSADLMLRCRRIAYLDEVLYFYFQNPAGTVRKRSFRTVSDEYAAIAHQRAVISGAIPARTEELRPYFIWRNHVLLKDVFSGSMTAAERASLARRIQAEQRSFPPDSAVLTPRQRPLFLSARLPFPLFYLFWSLLGRRAARQNTRDLS